MQLIESSRDLKSVLKIINDDKKVGFVPTMGSLHEGHLQLVRLAKQGNDVVVVSIFVNKRQFNDSKDFEKYPKSLEADLLLLQAVCEEVIVYAPSSASELFPENFSSVKVTLDGIENEMEGKSRPGHFQGVIDVVHQFFSQVHASTAYFGEKDFQQLAIIRMLAEQHFPQLTIVGVPTIRNSRGLALSSRNALLTNEELIRAEEVNKSLSEISSKYHLLGDSIVFLETSRLKELGFVIDYIAVANSETLKSPLNHETKESLRAFAAVFLGNVRLIDNVAIKA